MRPNRLFVCLILVFAGGCQTAQMEIAPSLASTAAPMDVHGANPRRWNTPIHFGPWWTVEAREGMTWQFGHRLLGLDAQFMAQPYRFVLAAEDQPLQGECVTRALALSRKGVSLDPSLGHLPPLACGFQGGAGEGTLRLRNTARNTEQGEVTFEGTTWEIRSVHEIVGGKLRNGYPVGYEIRDGDQILAAVETMNHGRVWMAPPLNEEDQARIALVATALLMYEPPAVADAG